MRIIKITILMIVCLSIPFLGILRIGHTGITSSMALGSCSSVSLGGAATGSSESADSGTADFSTGEPIDIPVSIAKGIEPVDATQFQAEFGGGASLIKSLYKSVTEESIIIRGKTQQSSVTVVAYVDGNQIFEENVGEDRSFTLTTTTAIYDEPIAFVVRGEGGTASYPVIVTIQEPSSLFDFLASMFHVTNITGVAVRTPAVSQDHVTYLAVDIDNSPLLAITPIDGGYPELFSDGFEALLNYIHYSSDGTFLIGITSDGTLGKVMSDTGDVSSVGSTNVTDADFRLSPDDAYLVTHYYESDSYVLKLIDLDDPNNTTILTASTDTEANTSISFDWITEDLLVVLKNRSGGSQVTDIYNLADILGTDFSATTTLTPTTVRTSSDLVSTSVRTDPYTQAQFATVCVSGSSNGLCLDNFSSRSAIVNSDESLLDIANPTWTANGEIIVFDALPSSDSSDRVLAAYVIDTDETLLLGYGFNAKASSVDANIVMYQSYDVTGEVQIGLINLAIHPQTSALFE